MFDLIIIGSGPAGLSAAVYGKRAGLNLLVIEQNPVSGGQILNTHEIDNYLGLPGINGFDMGRKFREHADNMETEFVADMVTGLQKKKDSWEVVAAEGNSYEAKAVILAMGARYSLLEVPGEQEFKGLGVSYCATCDGAFFKGMDVAVVGGGDVAAGDAIYLARMCRKVHLIHRRDSLRAAKSLQEKLFACENVEIHWDTTVEEIYGNDLVDGVVLLEGKEKKSTRLSVQGVFVAIGMRPNTAWLENVVDCDEGGYIKAGEDCVTSMPGIFAAGDIRTKMVRQIVTAVADGACAVASVEKYLL